MLSVRDDPAEALERVTAWRVEMLMSLGITHPDAVTLAYYRDLDWHQAEELVRRGCPPELVFEILT